MNKLIDSSVVQTENETEVTFADVKDPCSPLYDPMIPTGHQLHTSVPLSERKRIVNLYCMKKRCEEEKVLLVEEVKRLADFYENEKSIIERNISSLQSSSTVNDIGLVCLLKTKHKVLSNQQNKLCSIFKDMPNVMYLFTPQHDTRVETCEEEVLKVAEDFLDSYADEAEVDQ